MTKLVVFFLLIALASFAAETETLIGEVESVNFYMAPVIKLGKFDDNTLDRYRADSTQLYWLGTEMGFVVNNRWAVGLAGYTLTNNVGDLGIVTDDTKTNRFFYGGLMLKYILSPNSLLHFTAHTLLGVGSFQQEEKVPYGYGWHRHQGQRGYAYVRNNDVFTVVEPGVDFMLNVHDTIRLGAGLSYRYLYDFESRLSSPINLDGFTTRILLKVGNF